MPTRGAARARREEGRDAEQTERDGGDVLEGRGPEQARERREHRDRDHAREDREPRVQAELPGDPGDDEPAREVEQQAHEQEGGGVQSEGLLQRAEVDLDRERAVGGPDPRSGRPQGRAQVEAVPVQPEEGEVVPVKPLLSRDAHAGDEDGRGDAQAGEGVDAERDRHRPRGGSGRSLSPGFAGPGAPTLAYPARVTRIGLLPRGLLIATTSLLLAAAPGDLASLDDALARGAFGEAVRQSESRLAEGPEPALAQEILLRLSRAHQSLGDYGAAVEALERAMVSAEATGEPARVVSLRGALGSLYVAVARPADAERTLRRALAEADAAGLAGTRAIVANNLGNLHARQGDFDAAFTRCSARSSTRLRCTGDAPLAARATANAARALAEARRPEAPEWIEQARARVEALPAGHDRDLLRIHVARTGLEIEPGASLLLGEALAPGPWPADASRSERGRTRR